MTFGLPRIRVNVDNFPESELSKDQIKLLLNGSPYRIPIERMEIHWPHITFGDAGRHFQTVSFSFELTPEGQKKLMKFILEEL